MIALHAQRRFDGHAMTGPRFVLLDDAGLVADVRETPPPGVGVQTIPEDALLAPGFVDLQVNGGGGALFNDAISVDTLRRIAAAHATLGTTSILATLITAPRPQIAAALAAVGAARAQLVAGIRGAHVEGPVISHAPPGVHPPEWIASMTATDAMMLAAPRDGVRLVTLAPEATEPDRVSRLLEAGVRVFAGHTNASAEQADAAFGRGVMGATHLYNAMSQLGSRAPGMVGATLGHTAAAAGIIVDLLHVAPAAVRAAYRAMGPERLFLVSDAMPTVGSDIKQFPLFGNVARLAQGQITLPSGTLAGAHLCMAQAVRRAVTGCDIPVVDALRMATATPAHWAGARDVGRVAPGCRADLVALDPALRVVRVWQSGAALATP